MKPNPTPLAQMLAAATPPAAIAEQLGLSEAEVRLQASVLEAVELRGAQRRRRTTGAAFVACTGLVAFLSWPAIAQGICNQTLPAPMATFCPNSPAIASQLNGNFQQLVNWTQQKIGALGTSDVTVAGNFGVNGTSWVQTLNAASVYATAASVTTASISTGNIGTANITTANVTNLGVGGNATVSGALTANGVGGNVPHGCLVRTSQIPATSYNIACGANEIAVGGGGRCNTGWRLTESLPWAGAADSSGPPSYGATAPAWRAVCQVWGDALIYAYPQMGVYVICCAR